MGGWQRVHQSARSNGLHCSSQGRLQWAHSKCTYPSGSKRQSERNRPRGSQSVAPCCLQRSSRVPAHAGARRWRCQQEHAPWLHSATLCCAERVHRLRTAACRTGTKQREPGRLTWSFATPHGCCCCRHCHGAGAAPRRSQRPPPRQEGACAARPPLTARPAASCSPQATLAQGIQPAFAQLRRRWQFGPASAQPLQGAAERCGWPQQR
mmetsp:Transcript_32013/g.80299  ORF Transcript_32013/g.80299 Transcript_32013/m.80299 type:complete len:209 (+) Transcript_32013:1186-1812(+)